MKDKINIEPGQIRLDENGNVVIENAEMAEIVRAYTAKGGGQVFLAAASDDKVAAFNLLACVKAG